MTTFNAATTRAIEARLLDPFWRNCSNVYIAESVGHVSDETVRRIRARMEGADIIRPAPIRLCSNSRVQRVRGSGTRA